MLLVGLSQPPGGPLVLRAVRGQNASQWWLRGCQEAACTQLCSVAGCQAPGSSAAGLWAPVLPLLASGMCHPPSPHAAFSSMAPFCLFRWQMTAAFLLALVGHRGTGWPCQAHRSPRDQSAAGAVTWQTLRPWVTGCVTCCVSESPTAHQSRPWLCFSGSPGSTLSSKQNLLRAEHPYFQHGWGHLVYNSIIQLEDNTCQPSLLSVLLRCMADTSRCWGISLTRLLPPFATIKGCILSSFRALRLRRAVTVSVC